MMQTAALEHARDAQRRVRARGSGASLDVSSLIIAVLVLVGTCILVYPPAASWIAQAQQSTSVDSYSTVMSALDEQQRADEIASAEAYNARLPGGSLIDPWGQTPLTDQQAIVDEYEQQLDLGPADVMARIRIPSIAVDLPIYHGTSEATLRRGIGHLLGSSMPVGGDSTHSVLTGHRGLADSTLFTDLDEVVVGDTFEIEVYGEVLTYQVVDTEVVDPGDTEILMPESDRDLVSLVTCTPLGINSQRIIVTGERIEMPSADDAEPMPDVPGPPWWTLGLAAGAFAAAAYRTCTTGRPKRILFAARG